MKATAVLTCLLLAALAAGCGSSKHGAATTATTTTTTTTAAGTTESLGALQAEAQSAAASDIPDNQAFVVFTDAGASYGMKYPEGWAQSGGGKQVVIRDKNNIIRVRPASSLPA